MARVSQEHLDARRRQILDAARDSFADNGFHATSMQDIFAAAGLSAGAVYRYFRSKDELVAAIAEEAMEAVAALFDEATAGDPPPTLPAVLGAVTDGLDRLESESGLCRIIVLLWSEVLRSEPLRRRAEAHVARMGDSVAAAVRRHQAAGTLPADVDPRQVGIGAASLVPGFAVQRAAAIGRSPAEFRAGVNALLATGGRG